MAGIYITDMEMPNDKAIAFVIWPDGTAYSSKMVAGVCTEYIKDCKAIPVPDHGRLIDADALIKELVLVIDDLNDHNGATLLMAIFLEVLKAAPTIIPADKPDTIDTYIQRWEAEKRDV